MEKSNQTHKIQTEGNESVVSFGFTWNGTKHVDVMAKVENATIIIK